MEKQISVLCWLPRYFIRPRNTDWRHGLFLYRSFSALRNRSTINLTMRSSWAGVAWVNWRYFKAALTRRLLRKALPSVVGSLATPVFKSDYMHVWDIIYAYGEFPESSPVPVVWHTGTTDVDLLRKRGVPEASIERELCEKRRGIKLARLVAVSSAIAKAHFERQFPESRGRVEVLPFVLPNLRPVTESELLKKHYAGPISIVFVGREAIRKGLDLLVQAYESIFTQFPDLQLTVVSSMIGGYVALPPGTRHIREMRHPDVQTLMRTAHILAMPSREESFGLVYLEAFAAGAVVIAANREPQRSLLCNGEAGCLVEPDVSSVTHCLLNLVHCRDRRIALASKALSEFSEKYAENVVLADYEKVFRKALIVERTGN